MSFIRPEAGDLLRTWRDVIIGVVVFALGLWFGTQSFGALALFGVALMITGVALGWAGWQRARIRISHGGPGVIELTERQLSYFAAQGGVRFSLDDVIRVDIETTDGGPIADDLFWVFRLSDQSLWRIPGSADGAQVLIDMLAGFPGADYDAVIRASATTVPDRFLIWQKGD